MITDDQKKQLKAMISLMDEPDEETYLKIRHKVYAFGKEALPFLEKAMEETFSELMHQRITGIMQSIRQESLYSDLREWVRLGSSDLLNGHLLVTRSQYPDLDETSIIQRIEQMRMSMWLELNDNLTPMDNVRVINHILFDVNLFEGNKIHLNAPQNQYLNTLLETRRGSPLSLGMLYLVLTSKLNLPIYGVNLPQHFILTCLNGPATEHTTEDDVLFYINPFNKGAVFTRREIDLFLRQVNIQPENSFFLPCSNIDIIERLLNVLIYTYNQLGYPEKIMDLQLLLRALQEKI
ncbi:MAG TPA: transglutaminase-like domain-containing protein [Bacteroidales bacterium]|nr:transglutaminase-like domain-containing protein [Bacteroidales bacterium]HPS74328.1 transglutaminase-like domain-containing protein [Bacteroidales bacterium]